MPNPRFLARTEAKNLRVEIWINGIPAALLVPGEADGIVSVPLNEFIVPGANILGVMLHAGPLASRSADPWPDHATAAAYNGPASLRLLAAQYATGQPVQQESQPALATIEWQGAAEPVPLLIEREFAGVDALGRWAWQEAQTFAALDADLRGRALDYLSGLHALLAEGQFETFITESDVKIAEYARAYGIARGPVRNGMLEALKSESAKGKLSPVPSGDIDLRLVAGGRMIECLRTDRHHALEFSNGEGPAFFLPVMIGILGLDWRILR